MLLLLGVRERQLKLQRALELLLHLVVEHEDLRHRIGNLLHLVSYASPDFFEEAAEVIPVPGHAAVRC